ncbi:restriction endonuclease subunit S [Enterococcus faecalis]|nr:restriction endonuclease subunit S [Enterococcus faecalis]
MNLLIVFTLIGVWELCKLSGVIEKLSGGASIKPTDYLEDGIRTIPKGAVNATGIADLSGSKYISEDFFEKNITSHVHTNNLVTSLRDLVPSAPNMGRIVRIEGDEEQFLMPQGVYKLELFEGMDGDFLISFSNSDKYRKIISAEKNGSTQVHIRNGEFLNIDINLPSKHEQKKIGAFFKQLDDTITLHKRKLDQLKELKKAYLKAMFVSMNTKNNKVPKLRFTDFEGDWEQRKLGNISKMYQPQTITGTELLPSGYPVFGANGYIGFYSEMNHENDQVTISARGEGTGTINYVNGPVWITGNSMVINVNDFDINKRFLHANLSSNSLKKYITGGAQPQLTRDILTSVPIKLPNIFEQNKIGLFFKQLDETVNLHQNKLTQLKSLKKAYLQNMFI